MITLEFTGKTVNKAVEEGLAKLNKTLDEVEVNILSMGGIFRKARVEISIIDTKKSQPQVQALDKIKTEKNPNKVKQAAKANKVKQEKAEKVESFPKQKPVKKVSEVGKAKTSAFKQNKSTNNEAHPEVKKEKAPRIKDIALEKAPKQVAPKQVAPKQVSSNFDKNNDLQQDKEITRKHKASSFERPKMDVTEEIVQESIAYLDTLLKKMGVDFSIDTEIKDGEVFLNIQCENGIVIGYRGETLDAIEYLTSLAINQKDDRYYRINVDCNDYRSKRVDTLTSLAKRMADRSIKSGRKVVLEPMSSSSRKIIHSILNTNNRIITKSEGRDPNRRIIIIPKRQK